MSRRAKLTDVDLPDYGAPALQPEVPEEVYRSRFASFLSRAWESGLGAVAVYADREHCANLSYLTGFDPRFEEALLIAAKGADPVILTGPENVGIAALNPVSAGAVLYRSFGLLGQRRAGTRALTDLIAEAGVGSGTIGVVGWKYFGPEESADPDGWIDAPAYVAAALRGFGPLVNVTDLMMHPTRGMRAMIEIEELARFEFAATHSSESIKRVLFGLRPGMSEFEAASLMRPLGLPLCCHPMLSAGLRAKFGLYSPSDREIARGDPMTTAFGYVGTLVARAGFVAEDAGDLPAGAEDYVERLVGPYFEAAAEWYETIGIGVNGGAIDAMMRARLDDDFFRLALNPGHLIHIDEWMNTPIYPGSVETFRSGQAVQIDMIPATGSVYFTSNIEDGVALLDEAGRAAFAERYPEAYARIDARRGFMADVLGIRLKPEVLPLSNLSGYLAPFFLAPDRAMVMG